MVGFAWLPPETNSLRMYLGAGSRPLLAAAGAWDGLAEELHVEALEPAIATLQDAVIALTMVVNPLSSIAERIPLPGRRPARRSSSRSVRSQRVVDSE